MATTTIFKSFSIPIEDKSLIIISKEIGSEKYKPEVEQIRHLTTLGRIDEAQARKQRLLAFTPSATFKEKRLITHINQYSGFVHLDFDKLTPQQLAIAFQVIAKIPYTFLCFRSPSGNGLKVFIEVTTGQEYHEMAYQQVMNFYENATGLKADDKCKDITRLCFLSYDPELFKNIANEKFPVDTNLLLRVREPQPPAAQLSAEEKAHNAIFQKQIQFTNQKTSFQDGNRNNYVYLLASNCNRAGLPQPVTNSLIVERYSLLGREVQASVKSAYSHHPAEFAKFANRSNLQTQPTEVKHDDEDHLEDYLKSTPTISDEVFDALPSVLKAGAMAFSDKRKRDVFFTGAIAILSGCLPRVTGIYFQERVHPHLYTFIIAPAASGKGVLKNAKRLADKYHQQVLAASREAQKRYEGQLVEYKENLRNKKKSEPAPEQPEEPAFKIVFIPADSSQSRMINHLQNNEGQGIICETEADTMSGAKKQDWGDYSPILRSAFHHEKIAFSRKTNNEYIEINEPRLAVALSGTPAQAPKLISSAEDGLFSRFLFYAFKNEILWQDPSPKSHTVVYNDHFDALADEVLRIIGFLEQCPTDIQLQPDQWESLNTTFTRILSEVTIFTSEEASGIVYRLGLILFRLCMIFTALRKVEDGDMTETVFCSEADFNTALLIAQTYLQHSLLMFNNLPKQSAYISFHGGDSKRKFFEALPAEFTRKQATTLGAQFKLGARTVDELLKTALGKTLSKLKPGTYCKISSVSV
jgi:hypothetical protein